MTIQRVIEILRTDKWILTEGQSNEMADLIEKLHTLAADAIDINFRVAMETEKAELATCRLLEQRYMELRGKKCTSNK